MIQSAFETRIGSPELKYVNAVKAIREDLISPITDVVRYHSRLNIDDCPEHFLGDKRRRLLALLLRFADELDITKERVNMDHVRYYPPPLSSEYWWWIHYCTTLIELKNNMIVFYLRLNEKDKQHQDILQRTIVNTFLDKNQRLIERLGRENIPILLTREVCWDFDNNLRRIPPDVLSGLREEIEITPLPKSPASRVSIGSIPMPPSRLEEDLSFSVNAIRVLEARLLRKDEDGNTAESPVDMFRRVAKTVSLVDIRYKPNADVTATEEDFYNAMTNFNFLPDLAILRNAGSEVSRLSHCSEIPLENSVESVFGALKDTVLIRGGGSSAAISFSELSPRGDILESQIQSGPVSILRIFDKALGELARKSRSNRGQARPH